jgi:hypothetical protein
LPSQGFTIEKADFEGSKEKVKLVDLRPEVRMLDGIFVLF